MNKLIGGIALLVLVGAGSSAHADGPRPAGRTARDHRPMIPAGRRVPFAPESAAALDRKML